MHIGSLPHVTLCALLLLTPSFLLPATPSQRRDDAEKAMFALNGLILHDYEMRIGWGKAVPIPPMAVYPPQVCV